jgi:hypothetical protein
MHLPFHRTALRACRALALVLLAAVATPAMATSVQFAGTVGYSSDYATFTVLVADGIRNTSTTTSANLRLELWASAQPFTGSFANAYRMAVHSVGTVAGGATTGKITGVVPFTPPPGGIWYFSMVLTEYAGAPDNQGYARRAHLNFAERIPIVGSAPPPPVDTTPPTATIASPTGGNVSGTVTVSATASDNVGVTRVDFYVNGSKVGSDSAAPYQYSWNTTTRPNGSTTLRAIAVDAAGNTGQSALVTVNVANAVVPPPDTTKPTVNIASPTGGNVSGTVAVTANATDNVGVTKVEFYVNGSLKATDTAAPYQYSWNTAALANGSATLSAKAFDAAGNVGQSANVTVNVANAVQPPVDATKPTVNIASPTGGSVSGTVAVSANASDNVGVTKVEFYVNGSLKATDTAAPYQYSWNTTASANGTATLYAKAFDAAGNSAQSTTVSVTVANVTTPPVDSTKPTVTIAAPTGGTASGTVTVKANASDNVGVTWVFFLVNGNILGSASKAPWSIPWNSRSVGNGTAKLEVLAMDAAGNRGISAPVYVNVANAAGPASLKLAVEYYNPELDHYFVTSMDDEIEALDAGRLAGWYRTGASLDVYSRGAEDGNPVCRFYLPPDYGDSHFYSATPTECEQVAQKFPRFAYETTEVFRVHAPDLQTGQCPPNTVPIYRLWNNRADSNHRYTSDRATRDAMVAEGYIPEGYGPDPVIMCGVQ